MSDSSDPKKSRDSKSSKASSPVAEDGASTSNLLPMPLPVPMPYPDVPPPSYGDVSHSSGGVVVNPQFYAATGIQVKGAASGSGLPMALPVHRYDTMTSYTEDGSGVQTIITTGTVLDRPILVKCPFCKTTVTTEIKPVSGCLSWLCCMGLTMIGCVYGCCLIPFCSTRLRDVEHFCPKCHNTVALYKRI